MQAGYESGALKKLHRMAWPFQQTFQTPLPSREPARRGLLKGFSASIADSFPHEPSGRVVIDKVIFDSTNLQALLAEHGLAHNLRQDSSIVAEGSAEVAQLLFAALSDSVDFLFIPIPRSFVLYADHDEYATFFASTRSNLNKVESRMTALGFPKVEDYLRKI